MYMDVTKNRAQSCIVLEIFSITNGIAAGELIQHQG